MRIHEVIHLYWWRDVYLEKYRLWYHFHGLSHFIDGVDLSQYSPFSPLTINGPGGEPGQAFGLGLRGDNILVWLRSDAYTQQAVNDRFLVISIPDFRSGMAARIDAK